MNNKQRFDVRDNNPLHGAPTARSGIFTTGASSSSNEMKKSNIPHIPGSIHKTDLSAHTDMVVVFQTIELERLSLEIEALRVSLKDRERQLINYENYEVQIAELTEQCLNTEGQRDHYQAQLQKMSLACNALYDEKEQILDKHQNEVQLLNRKFYNAEEQHQNEVSQLKSIIQQLQNEIQNKQNYERETMNKSKLTQQQLSRLNETILQDRLELDDIKNDRDRINQELERCMSKLGQQQNKLRDEMASNREDKENLNKCYQQIKQYERVIDILNRDNTKLKDDNNDLQYRAQNMRREGENSQQKVQEYKVRLEQNNQDLNRYQQKAEDGQKINQILKNDLDNMERAYNEIQEELKSRDDKYMELIRGNEALANQLTTERDRAQDLSLYAQDLNAKIDQGLAEISRCKEALKAYDQHISELQQKKRVLQQQLEMLQPVLKMKNDLQEEVYQLKEQLSDKDEELAGRDSYIQEITIENKELTSLGDNLQNNINIMNQNMRAMEHVIDQEREEFQKIRQDLNEQFNKNLENQRRQKAQLSAQLEKLKKQGLIREQTIRDLINLKKTCEAQAQQIFNQKKHLQIIPEIIKKLKQMNADHIETQKANETMRQQLTKSVSMNEQLIEQIGSLLKEIQKLNEEIWSLQEKLISQRDKNYDYQAQRQERRKKLEESYPISSPTTEFSSITSATRSLNPYIADRNKEPSPTLDRSTFSVTNPYKMTRFSDEINRNSSKDIDRPSSKDRLSPYRKLPPETSRGSLNNNQSTSITEKNSIEQGLTSSRGKPFGGHEGSKIKKIKTNLTGGLSNMGRDGVFKSHLLGEGPLVESKKYFEPTTITQNTGFYPPYPETKKFSGNDLPHRQDKKQRDPSYQKFKRDWKGK